LKKRRKRKKIVKRKDEKIGKLRPENRSIISKAPAFSPHWW
jgi:hypothetical protein